MGSLLDKALKMKEDSNKKLSEEKILPDSQDEKITPEENDQKVTHAQPEKNVLKSNFAVEKLDQKINERINKRLLNLVKLGLKHELTIDNMIHYFKQVNKAKLYELRRFFSDSPGYKIEKMLKFLYTSGELKKDKDHWYSLK